MLKKLKGQSNGILFVIATISSLQGLLTFGALYMSQPWLFDLNVFNPNPGQGINDQYNQPGNITTVETILAGLSFAIGLFAAGATLAGKTQAKNSNLLMVATGMYVIVFALGCYHSWIRAEKLGVLYEFFPTVFSTEGTCKDVDWRTGCPTSRFRYRFSNETKPKIEIDDLVELNTIAQCRFNAYQNGTDATGATFKVTSLETSVAGRPTVNWADKNMYDNVNINPTSSTDKGVLHDAANYIKLLQKDGKCEDYGVPVIDTSGPYKDIARCRVSGPELPDISWCWYWGCSEACNDRYQLNRIWLWLSGFSTLCYFILAVMSAIGVKVTSDEVEDTVIPIANAKLLNYKSRQNRLYFN